MQVLKIFTPFLICCIFWGINVECGKKYGIKAAGKQHQGEVQAKPAANMAIVKKKETLKAKSKGMKKTAGGQVQKQKKHAAKKAHEELGKGKEVLKKSPSAADSKAACMQKCMCEKSKANNNFNGQKERTTIRVKRDNEYCENCHNKVNERWCSKCEQYCGVYSGESTDLNCYYCDHDDIEKLRNEKHYCLRCNEQRDSDKVYEWMERSESLEESDDDDTSHSSNADDPCMSANADNYFKCVQCLTDVGCVHLSSVLVGMVKCEWVDNQGCTKFVKVGLDGNELVDSD